MTDSSEIFYENQNDLDRNFSAYRIIIQQLLRKIQKLVKLSAILLVFSRINKLMSFGRQPRKINQQAVFNPPPGYYEHQIYQQHRKALTFGQQDRFTNKTTNNLPGPGAYFNHQKDVVRKRLIDQSQRREAGGSDLNPANNIKISSIPSIPKKSATRVYEQLAPGILILHEQQYENASVGPGSYNIANKLVHPKAIAHKIAPEHRRKVVVQDENVEINVPTVAQQIRNVRRMMYKQNLIKASTVNKAEINPSDLCLEVIILREKLLRSDENPPPGYYHNENLSDFKIAEDQRTQNQFLGGRQKRFQHDSAVAVDEIGPGSYKFQQHTSFKGGFIPKQTRKLHALSEDKPGPGKYIIQKEKQRVQIKGNYPPIFGSGCTRFPSAPKTIQVSAAPGPGSYQIEKKKNKKQRYIKLKKQLLQPSKGDIHPQQPLGIQSELSHMADMASAKERKLYQYTKNSSNFASKVQRFQSNKTFQESVGPGVYEHQDGFYLKSFNKKVESYVGNRVGRFDQTQLRPKIGPGTYNPAYETVKEKKILNVIL